MMVAETGDLLRFNATGAEIVGKAPVGKVLIDQGSLEEVGEVVIRDRKHISEDGIVVSIVAINKQTGMIEQAPEMVIRGVGFIEETRLLLESKAPVGGPGNASTAG